MLHRVLLGYRALFADPDRRGSIRFSLMKRGIVWLSRNWFPFPGAHCSCDPLSLHRKQAFHHVFEKEGVSWDVQMYLSLTHCHCSLWPSNFIFLLRGKLQQSAVTSWGDTHSSGIPYHYQTLLWCFTTFIWCGICVCTYSVTAALLSQAFGIFPRNLVNGQARA